MEVRGKEGRFLELSVQKLCEEDVDSKRMGGWTWGNDTRPSMP